MMGEPLRTRRLTGDLCPVCTMRRSPRRPRSPTSLAGASFGSFLAIHMQNHWTHEPEWSNFSPRQRSYGKCRLRLIWIEPPTGVGFDERSNELTRESVARRRILRYRIELRLIARGNPNDRNSLSIQYHKDHPRADNSAQAQGYLAKQKVGQCRVKPGFMGAKAVVDDARGNQFFRSLHRGQGIRRDLFYDTSKWSKR